MEKEEGWQLSCGFIACKTLSPGESGKWVRNSYIHGCAQVRCNHFFQLAIFFVGGGGVNPYPCAPLLYIHVHLRANASRTGRSVLN